MKLSFLLIALLTSTFAQAASVKPYAKYLVCFPTDQNNTSNIQDAVLSYGPQAWAQLGQTTNQDLLVKGVLQVSTKDGRYQRAIVDTLHVNGNIESVTSNARGFRVFLSWEKSKHKIVNGRHAFILPNSLISVFDLRASYKGSITCSAPN